MSKKRRNHLATFKEKVAMDAIKGEKTLSTLATQYELHPTQIRQRKKQVLVDSSINEYRN